MRLPRNINYQRYSPYTVKSTPACRTVRSNSGLLKSCCPVSVGGSIQLKLKKQSSKSKAMQQSRLGEKAFERMEKVSVELFAITYGSMVRQLFNEVDSNVDEVNTELDAVGYRIGMRLVDEYLAKSGAPHCGSFQDAAHAVAKIGLKMFLDINANAEPVAENAFSITFDDNPLNTFVELPDQYRSSLWYSNVLCGVVRGALDMVGMHVTVAYKRDVLRGDETNEIVITSKRTIDDQFKNTQD